MLINYISNLQGNQHTKGSNYNTSGNKDNVVEIKGNDDIAERQKKNLENNDKIDN